MAGRPRKPTALRLLEANASKRPLSRPTAPAVAKRPRMPALVASDPAAAREWRRVLRAMPAGFYTDADCTTIAAHCLAWARLTEAWRQIEADGMLSVGSTGQPVAHPALGVFDRAASLMLRAGDTLGLSPAARARLEMRALPRGQDGLRRPCRPGDDDDDLLRG